MSVLARLKRLVTDEPRVTTYECTDCGNTFESAKDEAEAKCMECLGRDVEPRGPADG